MIRQLNSRRNDLAPISALPPELFGRIFTFVQIAGSVPEIEDFEYPYTFNFTSWLNFTYVSQKWRNIALNTPGLWDTPDFLYPMWARAMLERSKGTDLIINCDTSIITDPAVIKEVFDNHSARIREINLRGLTSSFLFSILENIWSSSESLRLRSLQLVRAFPREDDNPDFPYFPAHLLVQPSGLQRLEVRHCGLDKWYTQPHPLLTHLVVETTHDRPLLSEFVTALSGMPALERLEMVDSLPLGPGAMKSGLKVALSRLSFLRLSSTEDFFEVLNVLDFLIVPCTTRIYLACVKITSQVIQLPHIGFPLCRFLSSMTGNVERSYNWLYLSYSGNTFYLSACTNEQSHDPMTTDLRLSLSLTHSNHQLDHFLDRILPGIPLFNLQTLLIDITSGHDAIIRYFGQSLTLQKVVLQYKVVVSDFLHATTPKPDGYEHLESAYYSIPFPTLQSLHFFRTRFRDINWGEVSDCLMERYERGAGLQKLYICICYDVGEDKVRLLREIVPDVEWDGIQVRSLFDFL